MSVHHAQAMHFEVIEIAKELCMLWLKINNGTMGPTDVCALCLVLKETAPVQELCKNWLENRTRATICIPQTSMRAH